MKYFYLVRHGEKQKTKGDPPLSPKGREQAKLTAKHLSQFPVKAVFTSPMKRTIQTAAEIANILGIPVSSTPVLLERGNWGDDPNQSLEEFLAMWQQASKDRGWKPPVGDSSIQAGKRLEALIDSLLDQPVEHIVLVTHGGIITDFLRNIFPNHVLDSHISGFTLERETHIKECSITTVTHHDGTHNLLKLAYTAHLNGIVFKT